VLSARTKQALKQRAQDLLDWIDQTDVDLSALAHTLRVGRTAMTERLAFVAASLGQLRERLRAYLAGNTPALDGPPKIQEMARLYLSGQTPDWTSQGPRIGSLPTYPFEHKSYWVDAWLDSAPPAAQRAA